MLFFFLCWIFNGREAPPQSLNKHLVVVAVKLKSNCMSVHVCVCACAFRALSAAQSTPSTMSKSRFGGFQQKLLNTFLSVDLVGAS